MFMVEGIQPWSWLDRKGDKRLFCLVWGLLGGLIGGLEGGLIGLPVGAWVGTQFFEHYGGGMGAWFLMMGFGILMPLGGVLGGLTLGLIFGERIILIEQINPLRLISEIVPMGLRKGLISGGILGLLVNLFPLGSGGLTTLVVFLLLGGITGLLTSLSWVIIGGITRRLTEILKPEFNERKLINQDVISTAKNIIPITLLITLLIASLGGLLLGIVKSVDVTPVILLVLLFYSLILGLLLGLPFTGIPVMQHVLLRLFLRCRNKAPWNYAKFLNHATDLKFLQRIGGQFRFVHDLLREHLATYDPDRGASSAELYTEELHP